MNDMATQNMFVSQQTEKHPTHSSLKRRKISLQVSIEANADGRPPIQEVFSDGTFTTAPDSHFERTSAAASAFVARALAAPLSQAPIASASDETRGTDSDTPVQWASTALMHAEGSLWELGRAIGVIDSLSADIPLLQLNCIVPRVTATNSIHRDGAALLMAKRRCMRKCADDVSSHIASLSKWLEADNAFCDSFLTLRKRCHGVRRAPDGTPLIDVGDADFVAVRRFSNAQTPMDADNNDTAPDDYRLPSSPVRITFPAPVFLKFSLHQIDRGYDTFFAPIVQETQPQAEDLSVKGLIRRIRLARVSAFRRLTFDLLAKQASTLSNTADLSSSCITVDSGPSDLMSIELTHKAVGAPSVNVDLRSYLDGQFANQLQLSAILQTVAIHGTLIHWFSQESCHLSTSTATSSSVLDRLLNVTTTRELLTRLESVLDIAAQKLRVRLNWTRGSLRTEETRVRIFSTEEDGDGTERLLATVEPISSVNSAGCINEIGNVRIIPAFGVIIPAPDDPSARGRAVAPHSSSSSGGGSPLGLDDVPRGYACPVGGEVMSCLTLMLCVRLLDSLEKIARAEIDEILDVDRQCFTVIVSSPSNGRSLKAKVWPHGDSVGEEAPGINVWYNGNRIGGFSDSNNGRLTKWKRLLKQLVVDDLSNVTSARIKETNNEDLPEAPLNNINRARTARNMFVHSDLGNQPTATLTHTGHLSSVGDTVSVDPPLHSTTENLLHPNTQGLIPSSSMPAPFAFDPGHAPDPRYRFNL